MKANAPEKIWVHELSAKELDVPLTEYHIEYTRTDAFIEKAISWLKEHADDYDYTWYNEMEGESGITDNCIVDFRKYMKGIDYGVSNRCKYTTV